LRRALPAIAAAGALLLGDASPALAHGLGGRLDLPVPRWLFVYGAAAALVISFVALAALWRSPKLEGRADPDGSDGPMQSLLTSSAVEWIVRGIGLAVFLVVLVAALGGVDEPTDNLAPVFVYVWSWVGLAFACALFGNLWATLSPFDTAARLLAVGETPRRPYPKSWGKWPAALLLLAFTWLELVAPFGATPRALGVAIAAYTVVTLAGMAVFGREEWNRRGEAFAVLYDFLGRLAPLTRDGNGRVVRRPVLGGLPSIRPEPGLVAFVAVLLGSTTFDGTSRTSAWTSLVGGLGIVPGTLAATAGLIVVIATVAGAFALAMVSASLVSGERWHPLAVRFVHSLVPIAFAYIVAHYFSLLVLEGQLGIRLISDPFGLGWNLLGTAGWSVNLGLLSVTAIWYVQVAAIVGGHIGGVVLAHDRAVAAFPGKVAVRTQYALLAVMVLFTAVGLLILSGG
jgi:hypothetical protein